MKIRFTEEQIIKILKEHEGGKKAADKKILTDNGSEFTSNVINA